MPLVLWMCHSPVQLLLHTLPHCPASGLRLWGEKQLAWPLCCWGAGAHLIFSLTPCNTHTHVHTHAENPTLTHGSFCTLSFNQALSWASVTALSAQRVKDLSPQVTSLTDPRTDRPLAHLAADVAAVYARCEKSLTLYSILFSCDSRSDPVGLDQVVCCIKTYIRHNWH